jgi:uncharacterized membrane protein YeaQ/YmgE (transglycosylase-associated protein family)
MRALKYFFDEATASLWRGFNTALIATATITVAFAVLGGFLGRAVGWYGPNDPVGFLMAVLGAIVLLVGYRMVARRPRGA